MHIISISIMHRMIFIKWPATQMGYELGSQSCNKKKSQRVPEK